MKMIMSALAIFAVAFLLLGCAQQAPPASQQQGQVAPSQQPAQAPTQNQPSSPGQNTAAAPPAGAVKFSDLPVSSASVQIAPGPLSDAAKAALSGFTMSSAQQSDGSLLVTLTETQRGASNQVTLKPGQTLYFIETSYGDDPLPNGETSLGDDGYMVVDQNGYVVQ